MALTGLLAMSQRLLLGTIFMAPRYLERFGIPRAGFLLSQIVCARDEFTAAAAQRVIRGASRA